MTKDIPCAENEKKKKKTWQEKQAELLPMTLMIDEMKDEIYWIKLGKHLKYFYEQGTSGKPLSCNLFACTTSPSNVVN